MSRASNDLSHDTHLRAALRHAPDHALAPPAGVSQTILNAARHVHRPMRAAATAAPVVRVTVARPRALAWLHQWFASPRLAGGLATGLVAALGLGLWFDLGEQPVIEPAPVGVHSETRSRPEATRPSAADANDTRIAQAAPQPAPAPAPVIEPEPARAKRGPRAADSGERKVDRTERPAPPPAPELAAARREDSSAREAEAALAKASPPAIAAPPAPMADTASATQPAAPPAAAEIARLAQQRDQSRSEQRMLSAANRAAAAAAPEGVRASASDAVATASPAFALQRRVRSEVSGGHARWAWTPPGSPLMASFDDAGQAWLARVVQATQGRWTDVTERGAIGDAIEVRWWRDEWPQATLRIEADGVRWIEHGGRIRYAPLDAATLQRLRSP